MNRLLLRMRRNVSVAVPVKWLARVASGESGLRCVVTRRVYFPIRVIKDHSWTTAVACHQCEEHRARMSALLTR